MAGLSGPLTSIQSGGAQPLRHDALQANAACHPEYEPAVAVRVLTPNDAKASRPRGAPETIVQEYLTGELSLVGKKPPIRTKVESMKPSARCLSAFCGPIIWVSQKTRRRWMMGWAPSDGGDPRSMLRWGSVQSRPGAGVQSEPRSSVHQTNGRTGLLISTSCSPAGTQTA
jgi:hypothetical protein